MNLDETLRQHPFFKAIDDRYVRELARSANTVLYHRGQFLLNMGEPAQFFLIVEGKVGIDIYSPQSGELRIQTIGNGEILGWSWIAPPYQSRFDAVALEETEAIALDGASLREMCDKDPVLGYALMKQIVGVFTARLEQTRLQLLDIYGVRTK
jgi:CRP-like cAMP-binding protein